ncbi:peptidylprolyl isomerase [Rufibacter glacialis]|uniref:Peptidylprolyl isomerase n=1 Tax=Rufibacter glacialis TaxID=1259555 RepID=A0A5M8QMC4_9BACT|nr:peptidylprolyl isomerase [Rufibacter glacialis]KAA6437377.1 peptidylprolyl isomerase [Rufibacter glacialis]GGK59775.1 peptidylprolyl isomerase [Rufibacter glacialis]
MKISISFSSFFKCLLLVGVLATSAPRAEAQQATLIDNIVAKVGGHIILRSELEFQHANAVGQGYKSPTLRCDILRSLVQNKLLLARAEVDSVVVDESRVTGELDGRLNSMIAQIGGADKLEAYYNKSMSEIRSDIRRSLKEQLTVQQMEREIAGKIKVTPKEVQQYFNRIPKDSLPYFSTEVEVGQIVKIAQVGNAQKQAAKAQLEDLRKRILAGEDFAALARQFSQDPGSGAQGGELGFFKKRELVPEYEAAALKLQPGETSPVIESMFGYHIIQLLERRGEEFNTRHILIKPATAQVDMQQTAQQLDSIRALVMKDSLSFAKAAKDFSDDMATKGNGGMITLPGSPTTYIPVDKVDPSIFFVIDTLQVGSISKPLPYRTEDGKEALRILYLKSKTPPHQANMRDDYQKIAAAALADKRNRAIADWFEKNKDTVFVDIVPDFKSCSLDD